MKSSTLTSAEIARLEAWLDASQKTLPEDIVKLQRRILLILTFFSDLAAKNKDLLARLSEFMGISSKSEKGSQLANQRWGILGRGVK